jgi:hypothetical protein
VEYPAMPEASFGSVQEKLGEQLGCQSAEVGCVDDEIEGLPGGVVSGSLYVTSRYGLWPEPIGCHFFHQSLAVSFGDLISNPKF